MTYAWTGRNSESLKWVSGPWWASSRKGRGSDICPIMRIPDPRSTAVPGAGGVFRDLRRVGCPAHGRLRRERLCLLPQGEGEPRVHPPVDQDIPLVQVGREAGPVHGDG